MTTLAYYLKRGDTFDPEDFKTTHRLSVARGLLAQRGIEPTKTHSENCARHPQNVGRGMRDLGCWDTCKTAWPVEATDAVFEEAAREACRIQDERASAAARAGL